MSNTYNFSNFSIIREKDIDNVLTNYKLKYINVCAYKITTETLYPFISYLFIFNNLHNKRLQLPRINIENLDYDGETIIDFMKQGVINQLTKFDEKSIIDKADIKCNGLDIYNDDAYLFLDITKLNINYNVAADYRFAITNEIINKKSFSYEIDENSVDFFTNNVGYGLLYQANGPQYETPVIGYVTSSKKKLEYNFHMGIKRENDMFGESYYFTNMENAVKGSECVIRIAVFLGKMCLKENFPEDTYDNLISYKNNEKMLFRITDHNEKWKKNYDSIYVGKIELDNGEEFVKGPVYAFKNYEQHKPLSYEYIKV